MDTLLKVQVTQDQRVLLTSMAQPWLEADEGTFRHPFIPRHRLAVQRHLLDVASSSLTQRPNSWMGVTYRSLGGDMDFCQGAFGGF
ncbi:hypothetical protein [Streptomyces europaeiscabiei]|uniref:hypothetical protein n=1 Tax=Streptomyces europaeiscabiei TaxID=146819 RepID=UPI002E181517